MCFFWCRTREDLVEKSSLQRSQWWTLIPKWELRWSKIIGCHSVHFKHGTCVLSRFRCVVNLCGHNGQLNREGRILRCSAAASFLGVARVRLGVGDMGNINEGHIKVLVD